jgi:hypothetical protein
MTSLFHNAKKSTRFPLGSGQQHRLPCCNCGHNSQTNLHGAKITCPSSCTYLNNKTYANIAFYPLKVWFRPLTNIVGQRPWTPHNQGSFMIPILSQLPIHHPQPRKKSCLARQILRQAKRGLWSKEAYKEKKSRKKTLIWTIQQLRNIPPSPRATLLPPIFWFYP